MTTLSTHVLDTEHGRPAAGVRVTLLRGEVSVATLATNDDGRIPAIGGQLGPDTYRLVFDVGGYFEHHGFFERVSIDFRLSGSDAHYHIPLLLSPYACTSYRGS
jgi:5-hydroxyisourate hydrolase